jgi:hypothetical protein
MSGDEPFVWFTDDDNEIVGDDICSRCRKTIDEDEVPLLIFREHAGRSGKGSVDIARFHWSCADELIRAGIIKFSSK